jgi:hypothetical protein
MSGAGAAVRSLDLMNGTALVCIVGLVLMLLAWFVRWMIKNKTNRKERPKEIGSVCDPVIFSGQRLPQEMVPKLIELRLVT